VLVAGAAGRAALAALAIRRRDLTP
jgi:hypothetical protein